MHTMRAPLVDPHQPLYYTYPTGSLKLGSSLGNLWIFARTDPESNLLGLWASEDQWYCGRLKIQAWVDQQPLKATRTTFSPEGQAAEFEGGGVWMGKFVWVPYGTAHDRCVLWFVELENRLARAVRVQLRADATWPPIIEYDGFRRAEPEQQEKRVACRLRGGRLLAVTLPRHGKSAAEARLFGVWADALAPVAFHSGQPGWSRLTYECFLEPMGCNRLVMVLVTSPEGEGGVLRAWESLPNPEELYGQTLDNLRSKLTRPALLTPDPCVNRGFDWAKVNTLRTQCRYPSGYGFTNDPPQDILVVRDAAWYVLGNDFFTPDFSREMIDLIAREGVENTGMLTEYIRCADQPPSRDDYGLNINDDTPLFILAAYHHAAATRDMAFLRRVYPVVRRAANYILSQMQDDLVVCTSRETNVRGIASWRNIIPAYNLAGAVTEINAECAAALVRASEMASILGHPLEAARWKEAAERLREAIHRDLVSPATGVYVLARDAEANLDEAVTADIVFPLLFGVAADDVRQRVETLLFRPDFWTPYGARTVGGDQPGYDPEAGSQLLGGVWPNLTAWIAYAGRRNHPERVAEALTIIYRVSEPDVPATLGHVVPGEFPERLHGDTGVSRGMALSPWMPPTYLWLAISGLMGVEVDLHGLAVEPALPGEWPWAFLLDLPYAGGLVSVVAWRGQLHVNRPVRAVASLQVYEESWRPRLVTAGGLTVPGARDGAGAGGQVDRSPAGRAAAVAFRRGDRVTLFVARDQGLWRDGQRDLQVYLQSSDERPCWTGSLMPGEAARVVLAVTTGQVLEEERLGATLFPAAAPPSAAA